MFEKLKKGLKSLIARLASGIDICLNNLMVVWNASKIFKSFSPKFFKQFKDLAKN